MAYRSVLICAALCLCVLAAPLPGDEQVRAQAGSDAALEQLMAALAEQAQSAGQAAQGRAGEAQARLARAAEELRSRSTGSRQSQGSEDSLYERGTGALDRGQWDKAAEYFTEAGKLNGRRAEGALYWKAYAQNKLGQRDQALLTVQTLLNTYPNGRWANDTRALALEIKQAAGQPVSPQGEQDDELTLLALTGLQNSDPEQAVPILEKFLKSSRPPKLKERALFVLAQSRSPKGRDLLAQVARGGANPDLQVRAIKYLGMFGKENAQTLAEIYQASNDVDAKRAVLQGFMMAGQRDRVLAVAKSESNPDLRKEAIRLL